MSNIAKMMGHSTAAATGMVDKLQELGHLKRYTAAADRRKIMVRITEQGRSLVAQMRNNIAADLAQMMAREDSTSPMGNARRVARPGARYGLAKPSDTQKIDAAVTSVVAHKAATDARASGWGNNDDVDTRVFCFR